MKDLLFKRDVPIKNTRRNKMSHGTELWKRKFEPISDRKSTEQTSGSSVDPKSGFDEALGEAQKAQTSVHKILEALSDGAKGKIKETVSVLDGMASKSSKEARSFLAKTLESVAERIKPV
jgi:hypothetical protein